jgi:uncharacterized protein (UPF0297 family)
MGLDRLVVYRIVHVYATMDDEDKEQEPITRLLGGILNIDFVYITRSKISKPHIKAKYHF